MNGATVGNKQIVVRLHEPKQLRKEKLAQRFAQGGHNGHPRSGSGATSPTLSEAGDSVAGWSSPGRHDRHRRGSGSYYQVDSHLNRDHSLLTLIAGRSARHSAHAHAIR
jgi:polyadenylate-binding protein